MTPEAEQFLGQLAFGQVISEDSLTIRSKVAAGPN